MPGRHGCRTLVRRGGRRAPHGPRRRGRRRHDPPDGHPQRQPGYRGTAPLARRRPVGRVRRAQLHGHKAARRRGGGDLARVGRHRIGQRGLHGRRERRDRLPVGLRQRRLHAADPRRLERRKRQPAELGRKGRQHGRQGGGRGRPRQRHRREPPRPRRLHLPLLARPAAGSRLRRARLQRRGGRQPRPRRRRRGRSRKSRHALRRHHRRRMGRLRHERHRLGRQAHGHQERRRHLLARRPAERLRLRQEGRAGAGRQRAGDEQLLGGDPGQPRPRRRRARPRRELRHRVGVRSRQLGARQRREPLFRLGVRGQPLRRGGRRHEHRRWAVEPEPLGRDHR